MIEFRSSMRSNHQLMILALAAWMTQAGDSHAIEFFEATTEGELIGTWTSVRAGSTCTITFADDHAFRGVLTSKNGVQSSFEGTWKLQASSGNTNGLIPQELHYVYSDKDHAGTKDMDVVFDRSGTGASLSLSFRTRTGEVHIYQKTEPPLK